MKVSFMPSSFFILFILFKCFAFDFLSCGIRMYFPILTCVENGRFISWKNGDIVVKNVGFES